MDKVIETMMEKITKYSHCFNWSRENSSLHVPYSSLGSLEHVINLYDYFESSIQFRSNSHNDMPFSIIE